MTMFRLAFASACCLVISSFGVSATEKKLPTPKGIESVPIEQQFPWLLDNMQNDDMCFEYLKLRYLMPTMVRIHGGTSAGPSPKQALTLIHKRIVSLEEAILAERKTPTEKKARVNVLYRKKHPIDLVEVPKQWFYYRALLGWGERCINRTGVYDGGKQYRAIFERSEQLRDYPLLFRRIVQDFCMMADNPFIGRSKKSIPIGHRQESLEVLLPHFLPLPVQFRYEPPLHRISGKVFYLVDKVSDVNEEDLVRSFACARRMSLFAASQRHGVIKNPLMSQLYLKLTVESEHFASLTKPEKSSIYETLFIVYQQLNEKHKVDELHQRLVPKGVLGRDFIISCYQKEIDNLNSMLKLVNSRGEQDPKKIKGLELQKARLVKEREIALSNAVSDFSNRTDTLKIARRLISLNRTWEACDYLARFLSQTDKKDYYHLSATNLLCEIYLKAHKKGIRILKQKNMKVSTKPAPLLLGPKLKSPDDTYLQKAKSVVQLTAPDHYAKMKEMRFMAALRTLHRLKEKLSKYDN